MRYLRTAIAVLAAVTALGACTVAQPGTPKAGPSTRNLEEELGNTKESDLRKVFTSSPQQVNDYWSSDRMRNAKPRQPQPGAGDAPKDEPTGVIIHPTTGPVGQVKPSPKDPSGAVWTRAGLTASSMGRLYMSYGSNYNSVCSASVVNSSSGVLVATAAHCIWDTQDGKGWASNVMFIPGDTNERGPYGRWVAESIYAPPQFRNGAKSGERGVSGDGWAYDISFLRMRPLNGQNILSVTGGQGIAFDSSAESIRTIGYPTAPPFDGSTQRSCSSPTWSQGGRSTYQIDCVMTPGCSGGPWYTRFDDARGVGYLISTHSTGNGRQSFGSILGKVAYDLYKSADAGA
ncbi:trypsin-like serine peptidase [Allokutzneria oryzae]|uniref:Trypsin-like serine peptidase n=1 Tax=Allokutzneria oryzae TaxID=1378989 RepID=A0ABV5ZUK6_9PSEU